MKKRDELMNWKPIFFLTLIASVLLLVVLYSVPKSPTQQTPTEQGRYVTMYSDLNDLGVRVYYKAYVLANGMSESHFVGVCDSTTMECRKPHAEEIKQDKYIPQSPLN